mgnify:CR=1 FL=1
MPTLRRPSSPSATLSALPSVTSLITDSWRTFLRDWKETFTTSRWLILPSLLLLISTLLHRVLPGSWNWLVVTACLIFTFIVDLWVNTRLIQQVLAKEDKSTGNHIVTTPKHVLGYLWLKVFSAIAILGASLPLVLGALGLPIFISLTRIPEQLASLLSLASLALLSIPMVWLGISFAVFPSFLLFHSAEGTNEIFNKTSGGKSWPSAKKAIIFLVRSYELVRGNWWPALWRLLVPGLVFGLLLIASISFADAVIQLIAGPEKIQNLFGTEAVAFDVNNSSNSYAYFLQSVGQAIFLPLFTVWQAKLFLALAASKKTA